MRKPVSQWSEEEQLSWGRKEDALRRADLEKVTDAESLKRAQDAAKRRRNAVGASLGQAFDMVKRAQEAAKLEGRSAR